MQARSHLLSLSCRTRACRRIGHDPQRDHRRASARVLGMRVLRLQDVTLHARHDGRASSHSSVPPPELRNVNASLNNARGRGGGAGRDCRRHGAQLPEVEAAGADRGKLGGVAAACRRSRVGHVRVAAALRHPFATCASTRVAQHVYCCIHLVRCREVGCRSAGVTIATSGIWTDCPSNTLLSMQVPSSVRCALARGFSPQVHARSRAWCCSSHQ